MLRPVPMQRLEAVLPTNDLPSTLREMAALGVVHVSPATNPSSPIPTPPPPPLPESDHAQRILTAAAALRQSLHLPTTVPLDPREPLLSLPESEQRLRDFEQQATSLLRQREQLVSQQSSLDQILARITPFCGAHVAIGTPRSEAFLVSVPGFVPAANLAPLQAALGDSTVLVTFPGNADPVPVIAVTTHRRRAALDQTLRQAEFHEEALLMKESSTPEQVTEQTRARRNALAAQQDQLEEQLKQLTASVASVLPRIEYAAETARRIAHAQQLIPQRQGLAHLVAWVPTQETPRVAEALDRSAHNRCVTRWTEPSPDDDVPILLKSHPLMRPFQRLVEAYGLPRYQDLVPTVFLALSYIVVFGLMFGDVGHGGILMAIGIGLGIAERGRSKTAGDVGVLLTFTGASSLVFGFVYGSCFGIPGFRAHALWHDPIEGSPIRLMIVALILGAVLISLGLVLNIVNLLARRDVARAVLGRTGVLGLVFYWSAFAWLAGPSLPAATGHPPLAWIPALMAACFAGWLLAEPCARWHDQRRGKAVPREPRSTRLTASVIHGFESAVGLLSNTISFLRLAAYAMSHAALVSAVWLIASTFGTPPSAFSAAGLLVLVTGNAIIIALEGTIAAVQALRLEYHEFFGRFFPGTGTRFAPLELPSTLPSS